MRLAVRVLLGALLGIGALVALLLTAGWAWWVVAAGALLGPVGFLGSFFLWSADRPEEGYEQVLFDRPNTLLSLAMLLVLAGAGAGAVVLPGEPDPAEAAYAQQRDAFRALAAAYQADADAFRTAGLAGDAADVFGEHRAQAEAFVLALDDAGLDEARLALLQAAGEALRGTAATMERCVAGEEGACDGARIAMVDVQRAAAKLA